LGTSCYQEAVGLKGNRLQIRLDGPYFAAFLVNRTIIDLQNRLNLASPSQIFASIFKPDRLLELFELQLNLNIRFVKNQGVESG